MGPDVLDARMGQSPRRSQARSVDLAARLGRVKIVTAPIRIEAERQAMELSPIFGDGLKDQAAAVWV